MERRSVLAGGILFAAGCSNPLTGIGEEEPPGVVEAVLLEDPPADAEVIPSDDDRLVDVEVIQALVRKASNPSERTTVQRDGREYETVALELQRPDRPPNRMREARAAIDTLRAETGGSYVRHGSLVLELGYVVPA